MSKELAGQLSDLVAAHWTKTLTGPFDWAENPLAHYTFSESFLATVDDLAGDSVDLVAWVCMMIASGLGVDSPELTLRPGRDAAVVRDRDGRLETPWRCVFGPAGPDALVVEYRVLGDGQVQFEQFRIGWAEV